MKREEGKGGLGWEGSVSLHVSVRGCYPEWLGC